MRKGKKIYNKKKLIAFAVRALMAALIILAQRKNFPYNFLQAYFNFESKESEYINISILEADNNLEIKEPEKTAFLPTFENIHLINTMEEITSYIYNIEPTAYVKYEDLEPKRLLERGIKADLRGNEPKVLIFHTHSQEFFIDSDTTDPNQSIVGVGERLANILAEDYSISVVHDIGSYDMKAGKLVRGLSYENMEPAVSKILEKYPSIQVVIDLHRDGVPDNMHLVEEINGRSTAKIMFFNGITKYNDNGVAEALKELENPYVPDNLALSLRLFLTANELYTGLARKNYIKPYRYSLHFRPLSMLVEVGANTNTVEEAMNAMEPLADIIVRTLERE